VAGIEDVFKSPFQEQLDFFRQKANLPSEHWDDIMTAAHDRAFMVAGATKADLLNDLRQAVDKAIASGTGLETFRKDFAKIIQRTGWDYRGAFDWRTRVIYQTNLSTSYAAGRWKQLNDPELVKIRPYWKYIHADGVAHPRPLHQAWNGVCLPRDDPWWRTHFTPNGWGCHCRVKAVSQREYETSDKKQAPDNGNVTWQDSAGNTWEIPRGIDPGFQYAPGASLDNLSDTLRKKADSLPPELGDALRKDLDKQVGFVAQPTTKAAEQWARDNDLADFVDYAGIKPDAANDWNHSLYDHLTEFSALRNNQQYAGTAQGQYERYTQLAREALAKRLMEAGADRETAEQFAKARIKKPTVKGNTYAHSWNQEGVSGVAINKKWGADPENMRKHLASDVAHRWHPPGCDTIRSVVDHEFGHQLDNLLALRTDESIIALYKQAQQAGLKSEVSGYAEKNIAEFIAECWAESCNNANPRSTARAVAEIVRARYRSQFA